MTTHRHKDSRGLWTTTVTDPALAPYAKATDLAALALRVAALEAPPPPPPPTPPGRPFPAPVTTQTVPVPPSIDATGATDASAALNAWLGNVPDGSILDFRLGTYRMDHGLRFGGNATVPRHNLVFELNGATFKANGSGGVSSDSPFSLWNDNTDIVIHNGIILCNNPVPGKYQGSSLEDQYGILIFGGQRIEVYGVTISNTFADALLTEVTPAGAAPDGVWMHDSDVHDIGRMGVAVTSSKGLGVLVERVAFTRVNWAVLDVEPNPDSVAANHVTFRNNTIGPQPTVDKHDPSFFAAGGPLATNTGDITVTGNILTGQPMRIDVPNPGGSVRRYNITVTGNRSDTPAPGPVMVFAHVDGLTVTGNTQPLTSGSLVSATDSTNAVTAPNP